MYLANTPNIVRYESNFFTGYSLLHFSFNFVQQQKVQVVVVASRQLQQRSIDDTWASLSHLAEGWGLARETNVT